MLLGCIADDFTGASDVASALVEEGLRTQLVLGAPEPSTIAGDFDAIVIALKTRSIPSADAIEQSLSAADWLRAHGAERILFKYCSTFDSTVEGNIGQVAEALATRLSSMATVVCPAFPATGRTVYQGHLFVGDRLLSESGMERHPINPMTDADIRRWLSAQTTLPVGHIDLPCVEAGAESIRATLREVQGPALIVTDALTERHLQTIGEAVRDAPLVTGGSGIGRGLAAALRANGSVGDAAAAYTGRRGPALLLSGSCSSATQRQVADYARANPVLEIDVSALVEARLNLEAIDSFLLRHAEDAPLLYSTAEPGRVEALNQRYGGARVAQTVEAFFSTIARRGVQRGIERLVVAGGETSGAVVSALGIKAAIVGPAIAPGVPALRVTGSRLALALKSGNFGSEDFFVRALAALESNPDA